MELKNASFENLRLFWNVLNNNLLDRSYGNPYKNDIIGLVPVEFDLDLDSYVESYKSGFIARSKKSTMMTDISQVTEFLSKKIILSHHLSCISYPSEDYPKNSALSIYYSSLEGITSTSGVLIPGINYVYTANARWHSVFASEKFQPPIDEMNKISTSYLKKLKNFKEPAYLFKPIKTTFNHVSY